MKFYRTILAAVAAIAIASPVFADDVVKVTPEAAPVAASNNAQSSNSAAEATVNVNKATAKELLKVKGINPAKARAIVAYRKKHGEFKSFDDLAKVRCLSKLKEDELKAIEAQLSLN